MITVKPLPTAEAGANQSICNGSSATLTASSGTIYSWNNNAGATAQVTVKPITTTTYFVTVTDDHKCSAVDYVIVTINPIPSTPIITQNTDILTSSANENNQWYNSSGLILNAINQNYQPAKDDDYYVIVNQNGCQSLKSNIISFIVTNIFEKQNSTNFVICPNPTSSYIQIKGELQNASVHIYNMASQLVYRKLNVSSSDNMIYLDNLQQGIYFINIVNKGKYFSDKLIIEK